MVRRQGSVDLPPRLLRIGAALAGAAFVVQTTTHLVDFAAFDLEIELLAAENDSGVFAWLSIVVTAAASFSCFLLALAESAFDRRLLVLSATLAFLSFDDMVQVHERVSSLWRPLGLPERWHLARLLWPAIFLPLLAVTFLLLWRLARASAPDARRAITAGLTLLVAAIALEATSPILFRLGYGHSTWPYELEVVLEEGAEIMGWILITAGVAARLVAVLARGDVHEPRAWPDPRPR